MKPDQPIAGLAPGSRLGPYEVVAPLGSGGMGEVFRARDPRLGRDVAIKVLPASFSQDPDRLRRFENEARAASALNHPNLLTIHDIGQHGGAPYIVSELLEGQTLRERLVLGGALTPKTAVDYGTQIAHGLGAAHEKGIVHRDLKPENIFVTADGRVKVLDFGLAKLQSPPSGPDSPTVTELPPGIAGTESGVILGTVGYMAPEQVQAQTADHRADIFAFGAVLYEMLTGTRAFHGASAVETMHAILKDDPPEPSRARPDVTPGLDRIVRRCVEKRPSDRFQSARDLGFALGEAVSGASAAIVPSAVNPLEAATVRRAWPLRWMWVGAALLALVAVGVAWNLDSVRDRLRPAPATPGRMQSLAVLPIASLSKDPEQEYFADGMTEALITDLAQVRSLRVISRTSMMSYKGSHKTVPEIARELGVDGVLEGTVERVGERVRVSAQVIEAGTARIVWAQSYERDLRDVFALRSDIAQAVVSEVRAVVTPDEREHLAKTKTVDPEAHELYLRGRFHASKGTEREVELSIQYFQQAIAKDPRYSLAYAGLAGSYYQLSDVYRPPLEVLPKAKAAALKAIELEPSLAAAHTALGLAHLWLDWDWAGAEREFTRALELNPGDALAHDHYGTLLIVALGRGGEGVSHLRRAVELDPLSAQVRSEVGWAYFMRREYGEAIAENLKAVAIEPANGWAHINIAISHSMAGRKADALAEADKSVQVDASPLVLTMAGGVYAAVGEQQRARNVLSRVLEIAKSRYICGYEVGILYIPLGQKDEAFRWLEKGFRDRSVCMPFTKVDPRLDPLRTDPRYADLIRRLGFPQ